MSPSHHRRPGTGVAPEPGGGSGSGAAADPTPGASSATDPATGGNAARGDGQAAEESRSPLRAHGGPAELPQRYVVREGGAGSERGRHLTCLGAQNLAVRVEPGETVSASAARRAPAGTIFLDGAAQAEPFMAVQQRVYNLDHHEGCVRAFTLATCEQAMVLVRRGLELRVGTWTIRASEPDLDTVLAIWVLLNHAQLNDGNPAVRQRIMPVLRLEGAIDAHGLTMTELCGFPDALQKASQHTIDQLRTRELELKREGTWSSADSLAYSAEVLHAIDRLVYSPDELEVYSLIDEFARVQVTDERIAVVCSSASGIYEVEVSLREQHGDRLGVIVLQKNEATYTLRQVDSFLGTGLDELYDRLNLIDGAVENGKRWGGSTEIGGSPRGAGTALSVSEIADAVRLVYQPVSWRQRLAVLTAGIAPAAAFVTVALLVAVVAGWTPLGAGAVSLAALAGAVWYAALLMAAAAGLYAMHAARNPRQYGARAPTHFSWLLLVPVALVVGAVGGPWLPPGRAGHGAAALAVGLPLAIAAELVFRGVLHGKLSSGYRALAPTGRWQISTPVAISAGLYAGVTMLVIGPALASLGAVAGAWRLLFCLPGTVALGLACGMARERSESVLPPVLLHAVAAVVAAYVSIL